MERLTARNENGEKEAYYPHCMREDTCDGDGTSEKCDGCDFAKKVCETLASYEETGLAPEQIREIDRLYAVKCKEVAMLQKKLIMQMADGFRWKNVCQRMNIISFFLLQTFHYLRLEDIKRIRRAVPFIWEIVMKRIHVSA